MLRDKIFRLSHFKIAYDKNKIVVGLSNLEELKHVSLSEQNPEIFGCNEEINPMKEKLIKLRRENELMQNQIEFKTLQLAQTNDLLERIAGYLRELKLRLPAGKNNFNEQIDHFSNEIKQHHSTGLWNEFKLRFADVHTGFYDRLISEYPALTETDLRLCALIKLKMSTKEIAYVIHQPVNSVKVARNRLRKKLRITDASNSLLTLLAGF
jgi:DNA-binding CsgD family transcriptional regulator